MSFLFFIFLLIIIFIFYSWYLFNPKKELKKFFFFLIFSFFLCIPIYFLKGKLSVFYYDVILEKELLSSEKIDPQKLIVFLERNLNMHSPSLDDILLLTRSYVANGYIQKANALYIKCLKLFPDNESLILEVAVFKKKNDEYDEAIKLFERVLLINPKNINNISLYLESIYELKGKKIAIEKLKYFVKIGIINSDLALKLKDQINKN